MAAHSGVTFRFVLLEQYVKQAECGNRYHQHATYHSDDKGDDKDVKERSQYALHACPQYRKSTPISAQEKRDTT
jgi:hypothetical protein